MRDTEASAADVLPPEEGQPAQAPKLPPSASPSVARLLFLVPLDRVELLGPNEGAG